MAISRTTTVGFKTGAWRNVTPIYVRRLPPCRAGCPVGNDVMGWVTLAAQSRWDEAAAQLAEEQPLPGVCGRVCYHPCETACNRSAFDEPVSIRAIERRLGEQIADSKAYLSSSPARSGVRLLVVGSGPAGLAAAWLLGRLGHKVVIRERAPEPGGLLRYGIPAYRLPRDVLNREIKRIFDLGISLECGSTWNRTQGIRAAAQDFDAVFLSPGAAGHRSSNIVSHTPQRVMEAGEFLALAAKGKPPHLAGDMREHDAPQVVIIGGGNSALDAARTAIRLGARATILYRRTRTEMPAYTEEIEATLEEGVRIEYLVTPSYIHRDSHRYPVLCCLRNVLAKPDLDGRRRPETIPGSEFNLPVSFIIDAVGDYPDPDSLTADAEEARLLQAQNVWGQTGLEKVWIGGDFGGGNRTVAYAIGSGKRAAASIHHHLIGAPGDPAGLLPGIGSPISTAGLFPGAQPSYIGEQSVAIDDLNLAYFRRTKRTRQPEQGTAIRIQSFIEVEGNVSDAGLRWEAGRCFHCGACDDCGNCHVFCPDGAVVRKLGDGRLGFDLDHCKGCGICKEECPRAAIEMAR